MLNSNNDYLSRRALELDLGRAEFLKRVQELVDQLYPGQIRALSLNDHNLKLITPSATVASDLRLRQVELLKRFGEINQGSVQIKRLNIQIRSF